MTVYAIFVCFNPALMGGGPNCSAHADVTLYASRAACEQMLVRQMYEDGGDFVREHKRCLGKVMSAGWR